MLLLLESFSFILHPSAFILQRETRCALPFAAGLSGRSLTYVMTGTTELDQIFLEARARSPLRSRASVVPATAWLPISLISTHVRSGQRKTLIKNHSELSAGFDHRLFAL